MSATEELRRLLDERGVEWRERVWGGKHSVTTFWYARGVRWHYRENRFGEVRLHADSLAPEQAVAATLGPCNDSCNCTNGERTDLAAENARLQEQMERLVTLLRNDCDIDASWDGLRRFWSIGLTEDGCLMRDRACKAEAENVELRAMRDTWAENDAKLRELVRDMWEFGFSKNAGANSIEEWHAKYEALADRIRELGMGVDADA